MRQKKTELVPPATHQHPKVSLDAGHASVFGLSTATQI